MKFRPFVALIIPALILSACSFSLAADITPPPGYKSPTPAPTMGALFPASAPDPVRGAAIYSEKCAACHGAQGLGDGPQGQQLPNPVPAFGLPDVGRQAIPSDWYATITQGRMDRFMPPFTSLTNAQRWDVLAYVLTLSTTPEQVALGSNLYQANCASCHGADGALVAKADLTDQAFMAKRSQNDIVRAIRTGVGTAMPAAVKLSDDEGWAVAAYVRSLTFAPAATPVPAATAAAETPTVAGESSASTSNPGEATAVETSGPAVGFSVTGTVTDGSGSALPADLKVVLHGYQHDTTNNNFAEAITLDGSVGADGKFIFTDIPAAAGLAFVATVDYAGTTYSSDVQLPVAGATTLDLPITIYGSTTDASALSAEQVHVLLDFTKPNTVQVVEFFIMSNAGKQAIVAAEKGQPVVSFGLPKGYSNLVFQDGDLGGRYVLTDQGFADTVGVAPGSGQYQVVFGFDMPYTGNQAEITQPFTVDVAAVSVLVPQGVTVTGSQLAPGTPQDIQGVSYQMYQTAQMASGSSLSFSVSGRPKPGAANAPGLASNSNLQIGIGAVGVALILAGVFLFVRDRRRSKRLDATEESMAEDADALMDAIITLDDQFRAGHLSEEAYQQRRAELKARLRDLL